MTQEIQCSHLIERTLARVSYDVAEGHESVTRQGPKTVVIRSFAAEIEGFLDSDASKSAPRFVVYLHLPHFILVLILWEEIKAEAYPSLTHCRRTFRQQTKESSSMQTLMEC